MNDGPQVDAPTEEIPGAWASLVAAARASRRDAAALEEWTGNQLRAGGLSPVERGLLKGVRTLAVEQTAIAAALAVVVAMSCGLLSLAALAAVVSWR